MKTKMVALVLALAVTGAARAEQNNTVAVDVAPVLGGMMLKSILDVASGGGGSGFGIGVQYERRLFPVLGVGGRFAYLKTGLESGGAGLFLWSFSVEGHGRWYPFGGTFFLDGLLGYATFVVDLEKTGVLNTSSRDNYLKVGGKLGWKFTIGAPVGFTFEMAYGFSAGFGGRGIFSDLAGEYGGGAAAWKDWLPSLFFVGGPKAALCFGVTF